MSREYGKNDGQAARRFLRYAMVSMLALSAAIYLGIFCFADPIVRIFNSEGNEELQRIAVTGLKLYFTSVAFVGYNLILSTYFTSVERALPAHLTSLLRGLLLIVPLAFLMSAAWGMTGVWLTFPVTELLTAVLGAWLDRKGEGKRP